MSFPPSSRTYVLGSTLALAIAASALAGCTGLLGAPSEEETGRSGDGDSERIKGENGEEVVSLAGGLQLKGSPKYYRVVRLTHEQWENAVKDVLGLSSTTGESSGFIPDPPNGKFSNNERALYVTDNLRLDYQRAAEATAEMVANDGALLGGWGSDPAAAIQNFGKRAFRRALTSEEMSRYEALWAQGPGYFQSGNDFADGARIFLEALLQSPNFVYRQELSEDGERLSGTELATKLSFLFHNTTPSAELLARAEAGDLDTNEGLRSIASQMLEGAFANLVVEDFHSELFGLFRYDSIQKSAESFPTYDPSINGVLFDADVMFFSHVYQTGGGVRSMLTSDVGFVNDQTAEYYGVASPGPALTQVQLGPERPGFLTRVGFLAYNANLSEPDPIHRGVDINNKLLCAGLEPPAGEIPPLPEPQPGQTNRERVTAHTGEGFCGGCHNEIINPPGFALENFDAMGVLRTTDNGKPVDTTGTYTLLDGEQYFSGVGDLTELLASSLRVHSCYAAHITEYALARDLGTKEGQLLEAMGEDSLQSDISIKELLLAAIENPRFTNATSGTP